MINEMFIENKRLDISAEISSLITFALDDVKDFASRNTSFSKTIVLPGTNNNNLLFGNIFNVTVSNPYDDSQRNVATNFNAGVSADCLMFQDHMQIFKGTLRLLEVIVMDGAIEYEVAVFGELGGLVAALGARKLTDLDFSAYDHVLNTTNIVNSWDASGGTGYYYPLIDVGGVSINKTDYDIQAFRPALFARECIDKIFTQSNYRYEAPLFDTERFRRLIIPYGEKNLRSLTSLLLDARRTTRYQVVDNTSPDEANLKFETFDGAGFSANVDKDEFTYTEPDPLNCRVYFRIEGDCDVLAAAGGVTLNFQINGTNVPGYSKQLLVDGSYVWEYTFDITLNNGDVITFFYDGYAIPIIQNDAYAQNCVFTISSLVPIYAPASVGDTIELNNTLPRNILQKDFLSSIIKLFNLYVYESKEASRKLFIEPYTDFYDLNVSGVVDWTYKVDRSKAIRLKPMSELTARYYDFKFKDDSDYYNDLYKKRYSETYGSRFYDSAFEFEGDRKPVDVIFSPTVLVGYTGKDKIVSVLYKLNSNVEERADTNIRILQSKKITGVGSWAIKNGATNLATGLTTYGYAGHYDDPDAPANDIHFGVPAELFFIAVSGSINVTQFNVYWSSYMAEITDKDSKLMSCYMKLNTKDIFDLDFSKLIYCDSAYWRLNKIEDWNASEPDVCKVELLKVINLLY